MNRTGFSSTAMGRHTPQFSRRKDAYTRSSAQAAVLMSSHGWPPRALPSSCLFGLLWPAASLMPDCRDAADGGFASCCAGSQGGRGEVGGRGTAVSPEAGVQSCPHPLFGVRVGHAPTLSLSPPWPSLWSRESQIPQMVEGCTDGNGVYKAPQYQ